MISIVMPTYNREKTIKRAIDSILNQTYKDFELIIVDDNSNDNSKNIIKSIDDDRIIYIKNDFNKGANESRNIGVKIAKGEYVAFQDSDDEWLENKLENQLKELQNTNSDVVACSLYRVNKDKKEIIPKRNIKDKDVYERLFFGNFISTQTILGKKDCFVEEKFDSMFPRFQDWEVMLRITNRYRFHFINKPLVNVYVQEDSISNDITKAIKALNMLLEKYRKQLDSRPKAKASLYKRLGDCYVLNSQFDRNYYKVALKYNKFNFEYILKNLKFKIQKYIVNQ